MESNFRFQVQAIKEEKRKNSNLFYPSITISREFGCEGYPLAMALHDTLSKPKKDWIIYSKELSRNAGSDFSFYNELREVSNDESRNMMEQFLQEMLAHKPSDYLKFKEHAQNVKTLSNTGLSIIVGGGGAILTQNEAHVFHVRLIAREQYRAERLSKRLEISFEEALNLARKNNESRMNYIKKLTRRDINDETLYHIILNNEYFDASQMADIIIRSMKQLKFNLP